MTSHIPTLADFGWIHFFSSQLESHESPKLLPARVTSVQRGRVSIQSPQVDLTISSLVPHAEAEEDFPTVGDWILFDPEMQRVCRLLDRKSLFKRRAAGTGRKVQLIAANVDTVFIVSSCNQDFNIPRLERYLVLAREAGVMPVVVLTKADLTDHPETFVDKVRSLSPELIVETVNSKDADSVSCLMPWCTRGQTVALLGSSGVGKSTIINTLRGKDVIATQGIREDDDKGRHTTSARALYQLPQGGWVVDTPGMRELQLMDSSEGLDEVFEDILGLATRCRFRDCQHETEPGCAVREAIETGELDAGRLHRWRKLSAEEVFNTESLAERRQRGRQLGRVIKAAVSAKQRREGE